MSMLVLLRLPSPSPSPYFTEIKLWKPTSKRSNRVIKKKEKKEKRMCVVFVGWWVCMWFIFKVKNSVKHVYYYYYILLNPNQNSSSALIEDARSAYILQLLSHFGKIISDKIKLWCWIQSKMCFPLFFLCFGRVKWLVRVSCFTLTSMFYSRSVKP